VRTEKPRLPDDGRRQAEQIARLTSALAEAQAKIYWLDRWHLDLDALMRRRDARAAYEILRAIHRLRLRVRTTWRALVPSTVNVETKRRDGRRRPPELEAARETHARPALRTKVTDILFTRVDPAELVLLEARLSPLDRAARTSSDETARRRLALAAAARYGATSALESAGLPRELPRLLDGRRSPPMESSRAYELADLLVDAFEHGGLQLDGRAHLIDLDLAPGAIPAILQAALPGLAITVPESGPASASDAQPRFPYPDATFDGAFAASRLSELSPREICTWFPELARIIRPGGSLVLLARGFASLAREATADTRVPVEEIQRELYRAGVWFEIVLPGDADAGKGRGAGTGFMAAEWLLQHATPHLELKLLRAGTDSEGHDLYVMRRP
jgi:hypothetical protein